MKEEDCVRKYLFCQSIHYRPVVLTGSKEQNEVSIGDLYVQYNEQNLYKFRKCDISDSNFSSSAFSGNVLTTSGWTEITYLGDIFMTLGMPRSTIDLIQSIDLCAVVTHSTKMLKMLGMTSLLALSLREHVSMQTYALRLSRSSTVIKLPHRVRFSTLASRWAFEPTEAYEAACIAFW